MLTWAKAVLSALLWDEAAFQRYLAAGLYLLGSLLHSGGVLPGTEAVVPLPPKWSQYGPLLQAAGLFLGAGGVLPGRKNGGEGKVRP